LEDLLDESGLDATSEKVRVQYQLLHFILLRRISCCLLLFDGDQLVCTLAKEPADVSREAIEDVLKCVVNLKDLLSANHILPELS
jgi:hypothetical protein